MAQGYTSQTYDDVCLATMGNFGAQASKTLLCLLQVSTRILGRPTAAFSTFLIDNRIPHDFTQDPSTDSQSLLQLGICTVFINYVSSNSVAMLPRNSSLHYRELVFM